MPDGDEVVSDDEAENRERSAIVEKVAAGQATEQDLRRFIELSLERYDISPVQGARNVAIAGDAVDELRSEVGDEGLPSGVGGVFLGHLEDLANGVAVASAHPPKPNRAHAADPVELHSGEFVHDVTDLRLAGAGMDFAFRRTYRSQALGGGPLGVGWGHGYDVRLRADSTQVVLTTGELRTEVFTRHPRFLEADRFAWYVPPDGVHAIVVEQDDSFARRSPDGIRTVFSPDPARPRWHRISKVVDRFGNSLDLEYDSDTGRLRRLRVNHPDRIVDFAYEGCGLLSSISDFTGRIWRYRYDAELLAAVTDPAGGITCYHYDTLRAGAAGERLVRIVDAEGRHFVENEYGPRGRVQRQRQGTGVTTFEYFDVAPALERDYAPAERPARSVQVVDRAGHAVDHLFNRDGHLLQRTEFVVRSGLPTRLVWRFRYNADGAVVASLSPEGVLTQRLYGRDQRERQLLDDADPLDELTALDRLGFGRLLTTVRRGTYHRFAELTLDRGAWGDVYPDVLAADAAVDVIEKVTYEPVYGQQLTRSDPRFTDNPDPEAPADREHPRHAETLVRYEYAGPPDDTTRVLVAIDRPAPDGPDGDRVVEGFPDHDPAGRVLRHVNARGVVSEFTYHGAEAGTGAGHLRSTLADAGGLALLTERDVDALGRVVAVHAPGGAVTTTYYDVMDHPVRVVATEPFEFEVRRRVDRVGSVVREERDRFDEQGVAQTGGPQVRTFCHDAELRVLAETVGGEDVSLRTSYQYDPAGRLRCTIRPAGTRTVHDHDERGLVVATTSGAGTADAATIRFGYDGDGRLTSTASARGFVTRSELDALGRVILVTDPLGTTTRRDYDKAGNLLVERVFGSAAGGMTVLLSRSQFSYDVLSRRVSAASNLFDAPLLASSDTDFLPPPGPGRLLVTRTQYDSIGRRLATIDPLESAWRFEHDTVGRLESETDPAGNRTEFGYDADDRILRRDAREAVPGGAEEVFSTAWTYDELGRRTSETDSLGNVIRFFYDSIGNLVRSVDQLGNVVRWEFDSTGRRTAERRELTDTGTGAGGVVAIASTIYEHDPNGNVVEVTDAEQRHTRHRYDQLNRRRESTHPDGTTVTWRYDRDDNPVEYQDCNGLRRVTSFDALNRPVAIETDRTYLDASVQVEGTNSVAFTYDGLGRRVVASSDVITEEIAYDSLARPVEEVLRFSDGLTQTITRSHDDAGSVSSLTYPTGRLVSYTRDELQRATLIEHQADGSSYPGRGAPIAPRQLAAFQYAGRRRDATILGNGTTCSYRYDAAGRISEIAHRSAGAPVLVQQRLHDGAGNPRFQVEVTAGPSSTSRDYWYDSFYRLEATGNTSRVPFDPARFSPAPEVITGQIPNRQQDADVLITSVELEPTLGYDLVGNRLVERVPGGTVVYESNELDQFVQRSLDGDETTFSYDRNGNLLDDGARLYRYDAWNRLVRVLDAATGTEIVELLRDADGRRVLERRPTGATALVYDGPRVINEVEGGIPTVQYVNNDAGSPIHIAAAGAEWWLHLDDVGSVRALTDHDGRVVAQYDYGPFGDTTFESGDALCPVRYLAARLDDDLDSYELGARHYVPLLGRFLQRDPGGAIDGTNRYAYCGNNPVRFSDRAGTSRQERVTEEPRPGPGGTRQPRSLWRDLYDAVKDPVDVLSQVSDTLGGAGAHPKALQVRMQQQLNLRATSASVDELSEGSFAALYPDVPPTRAVPGGKGATGWTVTPSGFFARLNDYRVVDYAGKFLDVLSLGLDLFALYEDPNAGTIADVGFDLAGVGVLFGGAAAPVLAAASGGYGLGKLADWGTERITYAFGMRGYEPDSGVPISEFLANVGYSLNQPLDLEQYGRRLENEQRRFENAQRRAREPLVRPLVEPRPIVAPLIEREPIVTPLGAR